MRSTHRVIRLVMAILTVIGTSPLLQFSTLTTTAADDISAGQWYFAAMRLAEAQTHSKGERVVVAIVDSGVDGTHPALAGSILRGADFTTSSTVSTDDGWKDQEGHGTAMAGLIVGHGRVRGVAPAAKVLPVRVGKGAGRTNNAAAIQWAADHGAKVISISGGGPLADPREAYAIEQALAHDVVVVAAVGNRPDALSVQYPAHYPGVLAVGATDIHGALAAVSVRGPNVLVVAPGERVSSTRLDHSYAVGTGTSDSTALVAGVVALVRSRFPRMTAAEVVSRLTSTATDLGPKGKDDQFGYGLVNPLAALSAPAEQTQSSSPTISSSPVHGSLPEASAPSTPTLLVVVGLVILVALVVVGLGVLVVLLARARGRTSR